MTVAALIQLLILILVVGFVAWLVIYIIQQIPLEPPFPQLARAAVLLIALGIILLRVLPLLGVAL